MANEVAGACARLHVLEHGHHIGPVRQRNVFSLAVAEAPPVVTDYPLASARGSGLVIHMCKFPRVPWISSSGSPDPSAS
jgi:hypothetical protein